MFNNFNYEQFDLVFEERKKDLIKMKYAQIISRKSKKRTSIKKAKKDNNELTR